MVWGHPIARTSKSLENPSKVIPNCQDLRMVLPEACDLIVHRKSTPFPPKHDRLSGRNVGSVV